MYREPPPEAPLWVPVNTIAREDHSQCAALLNTVSAREPLSTAVSDRLRREMREPRRGSRNSFLAYHRDGSVRAALFQGGGGYLLPVGLGDLEEWVITALGTVVVRGAAARTIVGPAHDVAVLSALYHTIDAHPVSSRVEYDLLARDVEPPGGASPPPLRDLRVWTPGPRHWRRLLALQMAYETEEVLSPGRRPDPHASRAHLIASLRDQIVLTALWRGTVIARVATNALGFRFGQVGGVYTDPAWRRRGVARWLMGELIASLAHHQRGASLFVKRENGAALALYHSLGFRKVADFHIVYSSRRGTAG